MIDEFSQKIYAIMEGVEYYGELRHLAGYCKGEAEHATNKKSYDDYIAQTDEAAEQFEQIESALIKLIKEIIGD